MSASAEQRVFPQFKDINISHILGFHMTSRLPCWCPDPILRELNSVIMQTFSLFSLKTMAFDHGSENQEDIQFYAAYNSISLNVLYQYQKLMILKRLTLFQSWVSFKDVRANCFCASLLRTQMHTPRHTRARALCNKMRNGRAKGHCYSFAWI